MEKTVNDLMQKADSQKAAAAASAASNSHDNAPNRGDHAPK
jgi:ribosomal protein L12E/L44/L45/RPP1/RPP2